MKTYTIAETLASAEETFRIFSDEQPTLYETGIAPLDSAIGGFGPGTCGILAADTGVGKSSLMLTSILNTSRRVGIISAEDGADVLGSRLLSMFSGVNSLRFRDIRNPLRKSEKDALAKAMEELNPRDNLHIAFTGSAPPHVAGEAARSLAEKGCEFIWLDYIQKFSGAAECRRNEVSQTFREFDTACKQYGVAGMAISQFSRRQDLDSPPALYHLKESGDLENEARVVILCHREEGILKCRLAKCTFGLEGLTFNYERDKCGTLREISYADVP